MDVGLLKDPNFMGQANCKYAVDPLNKIHTILGIQERIKEWINMEIKKWQ